MADPKKLSERMEAGVGLTAVAQWLPEVAALEARAERMEEKMIRYGTVCSGIEAVTVAIHGVLDWRPVFFSEIAEFSSRLLATRGPDWRCALDHGYGPHRPPPPGEIDAHMAEAPAQAEKCKCKRDEVCDVCAPPESLLKALLAGALGTWFLSADAIWVRRDGVHEDDARFEIEPEVRAP